MESFLLKAINGRCTKNEHDFLHENYHGDIEVDYLEAEKDIWKTVFRDSKLTCFRDLLHHVQLKGLFLLHDVWPGSTMTNQKV